MTFIDWVAIYVVTGVLITIVFNSLISQLVNDLDESPRFKYLVFLLSIVILIFGWPFAAWEAMKPNRP